MKRIAKIFALVVLLGILALLLAYRYGQQAIVNYLLASISAEYQVGIAVNGFALSLENGSLTIRSVEVADTPAGITKEPQSRIRLEDIQLSFSPLQAVRGKLRINRLSIERATLKNVQALASKFAPKTASPTPPSSTGILLPFDLLEGRVGRIEVDESFGGSKRLAISNGTLSVSTTPARGLQIHETLNGIEFTTDEGKLLQIGDLTSSQLLEGKTIQIATIALTSGLAEISGRNIALAPELGGSLEFVTDTATLPFESQTEAKLSAEVALLGTLAKPTVRAKIRTLDGLTVAGNKRLDSLQLNAEYATADSGFTLTVDSLDAHGEAGHVHVGTPLRYTSGSLSGDVTIDLKRLDTEQFGFATFAGSAKLGGTVTRPQVDADFTVAQLRAGPLKFDDITLTSRYDHVGNTLSVDLHEKPNATNSLALHSDFTFHDAVTQKSTLTFSRKLEGQGLKVKGAVDASGGVEIDTVRADATLSGELTYDLTVYPFEIAAKLEHGKLHADVIQAELLTSVVDVDLHPGSESKVELAINQPKLSMWVPGLDCGSASVAADLSFSIDDPMAARGTIRVPAASFGCGKFSVAVTASPIQLQDRKLTIESVELKTLAGSLKLHGTAAQDALDLELRGDLDLTFLGDLNQFVNDISGTAHVELEVTGSPQKPIAKGQLNILKFAGVLSQPIIEFSGVDAQLELDEANIVLRELNGRLNEGTIHLSGATLVAAPLESLNAQLQIDNMSLSPIQDTEVWLSADLQSKPKAIDGQTVPSVSGTITVNDGKLEKNFDPDFIRERLRTWFQSATVSTPNKEGQAAPIPNLDLSIVGDASFSVLTNLARADLSPMLTLKGNPKNLELGGHIGVAGGSFDVGKTHFEIISGRIMFWGPSVQLELFAEGEAKDENGFPVIITLELSGAATDPKVTLTSDNGLSQEEIISILAAGGGFGAQSLVDQAISAAGLSEIGILGEDSWLGRLANIDELSIEPSYDLMTGQATSNVSASKQLFDQLKLEAQFPFTGQGQSKVSIEYQPLPFLGIEAVYRPPNATFQASTGIDLNWALISQTRRWPLALEGNDNASETVLMNALGLSKRSRITQSRLPAIERKLKQYYVESGYLDVTVAAQCESGCSYVSAMVNEGPLYLIEELSNEGNLEIAQTAVTQPETVLGKPATKQQLQAVKKQLISQQRELGYYRARVVVKYEKLSTPHAVRLAVRGSRRDRYVFQLDGNKTFTLDELAKTLRLNEQSFPFGPNLPREFITAVEQHYLEHGYADLAITSKLTQSMDLITLHLDITEGQRFAVREVRLVGSPIKRSTLRKEMSGGEIATIFEPPVLYRAAVQYGRTQIEKRLHRDGYPAATVRAEEVRLGPNSAEVIYYVDPGKPQQFLVDLVGLPQGVRPPEFPGNISLEVLKEEVERLKGRLTRAGYQKATVELVAPTGATQSRIEIVPGPQDKIESVTVVGNQKVTEDVIRDVLELKAGDPLDIRVLTDARNRLLRRGLFSEVSVTSDEKTHAVIVTVRERVLQSLSLTTGYDSLFGLHLGANGIDRSLFSDGKELSLRGDIYYDDQNAALGRGFGALRFRSPNAFEDTNWLEELGFSNIQQSSFQEYQLSSVFLRSGLEYAPSPKTKLRVGQLAESLTTSEVPTDIILSKRDNTPFLSSAVTASIEYVNQDDPLTPRYSRRAVMHTTLASSVIGSEADYLIFEPDLLVLEPTGLFNDRLSILASARGGFGYAFGDTTELPLAKRFRLGGQGSVRGYRGNSLGPRGVLGSVIGGDRYLQATSEIRYELIAKLQALTFLDMGRLWLDSQSTDRTDFGAGVGVRYESPVGFIGGDVGVPLNPENGSRSPQVYFRLGAAF